MNSKKLLRPKKGRILFGVAAGIGNYFKIDPVIVRIIFVILTIWGGVGIILYIIGIFLIPEEDKQGKNEKEGKEKIKERVKAVAEEIRNTAKDREPLKRGEIIFGLIVVLLGLIFLFQNFIPWFNLSKFWPLLLILIGIALIAGSRKGEK